uniref:Large ribosomal subunit protein uL23c n=1 Tax=Corydalis pauciovulata TaxID=2902610 RepID=A0A8K1U5E1_9MAGN|nr:ribosomal protein L23 [Corydalis raddeana]YP_010712837.1 ribosomal protein L23 [Corydalis raddeana]UGO88958.1 ribosomal protein L23 [Corydalis pauciovulata]UGO88968.1 ribosomal protein L23 [Corydalis pauciovulata]WDA93565.1 ribosomal protein L23 [Corydalis raddeana]WDA93582.1 ribosomal protein L23 [Corydalis raddeana]WJZ51968.1 ribosomal protein L23 [Corydalis pauciovulata]
MTKSKSNYRRVTEKSVRLLVGTNQYTSNVEAGLTRTEIKHWVELFFGVKVRAINSHRLPGKARRLGPIRGHTRHYRRMIITLQPGYSIPLLLQKEKSFNQNTE